MAEPARGSQTDEIALHSGWMRRLARGLLGDFAAADDVVQDVWTKLGARRERAGYLSAVVRSLAGRRRRAELRRSTRERRAAKEEALPSADEVAARSEVARMLAEAVERLEEPYRTTVVLRYYDDLSAAEIARRAGIPASTVRVGLKRGLDILRARLDERGGGRARWVSALLPLTRDSALALASSVSTLLVMKLALVSLFATSLLVLVWKVVSPGISHSPEETDAGREAKVALADSGTQVDIARSNRREALLASSGAEGSLDPDASPQADREAPNVHARAVNEAGTPVLAAWLRLRRAPEVAVTGDAAGDLLLQVEIDELERLARIGEPRTVEIARFRLSCG
jgi:RNA polymerase sigma factor (sigma-70 family)